LLVTAGFFREISREELFRYFTLTPADLVFIAPRGRGPVVRLGLAVTLARCRGWGSCRTR
jgi:hypothetical protein